MRIDCPHCGSRDVQEFAYLGDAGVRRPDPEGEGVMEAFVTAMHFRTNPAGLHEEHWYHAAGCRSWLKVTRDTTTHEIHGVDFASEEVVK